MTEPSDCPHYDLIPAPDRDDLYLCTACGELVSLRVAGAPLERFLDDSSTVVAKEGDDVAWNPPGEG